MRKALLLIVIACFFPLAGFCFPVTSVLDQYHFVNDELHRFVPVSEHQTVTQTFTAGITGHLTSVDLLFENAFFNNTVPPLLVEIREMGFNNPYGNLLGTATLEDWVIPGRYGDHVWQNIDLQQNLIQLEANVQYSIVLKSTGYYTMPVTSFGNSPYLGGQTWYQRDDVVEPGTDDMGFRTYMATSSIPEPATAILIVFGLVCLGFVRQFRR